jgi:predicted ATPase/class 3 adenylate cyclase
VRQLPSGTVTLVFSDVEASTRLLQELGRERYVRALAAHREILRKSFAAHGGVEVEMQGDSFHFAFPFARDAVAAAAAAQQALAEHEWEVEPVRVRMGLHTGEPMEADGLYAGLDVHRAARVMSAGHGGQVLVSERTAGLVSDELPEATALRDLGEHRLKDLSLPQRLYDLVVEGLPADFPPPKTLENRPTNLPVQPTPLIGRERELAELLTTVRRPDVRLLTLTGPGGAGKTRLALHAAAELVEEFGGGVFIVFLAAVRDASLVLESVAQTLGVPEKPGERVTETLCEFLRDRELLLVLDNFEQVLPAAPNVGQLIARCEPLKVLVTSRAPLHLGGEHEHPVPPLRLPEPTRFPEAAAVSQYESVQLFVQRARAVQPSFQVTNENAAAVAAICVHLDGLPLALELAAARVRLLSPQALLERLDRSLKLLTGGARDLPERQQTLRATIDWSYQLLDATEQRLFRAVSVFAGGFTLGAAAAVVAEEDEFALLDRLGALVEHSLVRRTGDAGGSPRFFLLETIREYAADRLEQVGEAHEVRRCHADHYLSFCEPAASGVQGDEVAVWLPLAELERANLRAALEWLLAYGTPEETFELGYRLGSLWYFRGPVREGSESLERILARPGGDARSRAYTLRAAAWLAAQQGRYPRARVLHAQGLRVWRELDDRREIARELANAGALALEAADFGAASRSLKRALRVSRELDDRRLLAGTLGNLAELARLTGDQATARMYCEESLELAREFGNAYLIAAALTNLADILLDEGSYDEGAGQLLAALDAAGQLGHLEFVLSSLDMMGIVTARRGDVRRAVVLLAAAEQHREHLSLPVHDAERPRLHQTMASVATQLGPEETAAARERARAMSLEETIALAREAASAAAAGD